MKFFQARKSAYHTNPRLIDEVIYTTYSYETSQARLSSSFNQDSQARDGIHRQPPPPPSRTNVGDLLGVPELRTTEGDEMITGDDVISNKSKDANGKRRKKFDSGKGQYAEIFLFEYGTVVIWGMTEVEERRFISSM